MAIKPTEWIDVNVSLNDYWEHRYPYRREEILNAMRESWDMRIPHGYPTQLNVGSWSANVSLQGTIVEHAPHMIYFYEIPHNITYEIPAHLVTELNYPDTYYYVPSVSYEPYIHVGNKEMRIDTTFIPHVWDYNKVQERMMSLLFPYGLNLSGSYISSHTWYIKICTGDRFLYGFNIEKAHSYNVEEMVQRILDQKVKQEISVVLDKGLEDGEQWAKDLVERTCGWL